MKAFFRTSTLLAAGLAIAATTSVHAAGLADATSTYATIQPNAAGTHLIYTLSWVAPDDDSDNDGVANGYIGSFGNGNAALDNAGNLEGGDVFGLSGQEVQYIHNAANTATDAQWADPSNYTVGATNTSAISRHWRQVGNFGSEIWTSNVQTFGSGETGVTGVYSGSANGAGAATGTGVGVLYDWTSATVGADLGFLLSGETDTPSSGYVQVEIPNPTTTWRNPVTGDVDGFLAPYTYEAAHPFLTGNLIGADAASTDQFIAGTYVDNGAVELVVTTDSSYVPKIAVSGDFDSDLDVDVLDLIHVSGGFTGSGGTGQFYADGDVDADGNVDVQDLIDTNGNFTGSLAGNLTDTAAPDLIYDSETGSVTIDSDGGPNVTGFQLENASLAFVSGLYTAPVGADVSEATNSVLSYFSFSGGFANADLGNVLPTGLDLAALENFLSAAGFSAGFGNSGELDLFVVPEPSSLALLGLGGLLIARRRRSA